MRCAGACSDVAGEVAAALAHAAVAFKDKPDLSEKYWLKAQEAFSQTRDAVSYTHLTLPTKD